MSSTPQLALALSGSPLFAKAGAQMLGALGLCAEPVRLAPREHLFFAGDHARYFYWIESGSLTLYSSGSNGEETVFRSMGPGSLLAETVMYAEPCHYPLSAVAELDTRLYRMPRERLLELTRQSPEFCFSLVQELAGRISQVVHRIDLLTTPGSAQRLVNYLMDLYAQQGTSWLHLPASHRVIARQLNITPETFSRHMAQFRRRGLVGGRHKRELVLLEPAALCAEVGLPPPNLDFLRQHSGNMENGLFECCNLL